MSKIRSNMWLKRLNWPENGVQKFTALYFKKSIATTDLFASMTYQNFTIRFKLKRHWIKWTHIASAASLNSWVTSTTENSAVWMTWVNKLLRNWQLRGWDELSQLNYLLKWYMCSYRKDPRMWKRGRGVCSKERSKNSSKRLENLSGVMQESYQLKRLKLKTDMPLIQTISIWLVWKLNSKI